MIKKRIWTQQPRGNAPIDWSSPITKNLSLVLVGDSYMDCISNKPTIKTVTTGSITPTITKAGRGLAFSGASQLSISSDVFGNGDVTALFFGDPTASTATKEALAQTNGSNKVWFGANLDENENTVSGQLCLGLLQSGVNRSSVKAASAIDGTMSVYLVGKSAGSGIAYKNGKKLTVVTSGTLAGSPTTVSDTLLIGGSSANSSFSLLSTAVLMLVWKRRLSDSEAQSITLNPWQIFSAPNSRIWIPIATGGGTTYNINPTGSINYTSNTTYIKTKVIAPNGTVNISGTASLIFTGANTIYTITPSGQVQFSNSAVYNITKVISTSGLISYTGTTNLSRICYILPQGNITYSGSAIRVRITTLTVNGSIVYGGSAPLYMPGYGPPPTTKLPLTGTGI